MSSYFLGSELLYTAISIRDLASTKCTITGTGITSAKHALKYKYASFKYMYVSNIQTS